MEGENNIQKTSNIKTNVDVDFSLYVNEPEKLFPIAHKFFNKKQFEEGLNILEKGIELAVNNYGSESCIEIAKFYDEYGEGLIRKQMENDEILAIPQSNLEGESNNEEEEEDNNNNNINNNGKNPLGEPEDDEIAYENIMAANTLYLNYLKDYEQISPSDLSKETIKYYLQLADNYMLFGELETVKSDNAQAYGYYSKAVELRKKYDEKYSRSLAECYFKQASVLDYDPKKCLLSFYKTKVIMEHHLKKKVELSSKGNDIHIQIDENDLELTEISEESDKIYLNKKAIESENMRQLAKEIEDIANLVDIINELYQKIEDVVTELKEYDKYLTAKKQLETKNVFTENYDKDKVLDISDTLIKKKRPRSPSDKNNETNEVEKGVKKKKDDNCNNGDLNNNE